VRAMYPRALAGLITATLLGCGGAPPKKTPPAAPEVDAAPAPEVDAVPAPRPAPDGAPVTSAVDDAAAADGPAPVVTGDLPWPEANAIVARVHAPAFPAARFAVTDYGAVADGKTDSTAAFARAIAACSQAGGGHVVVPAGTFASGAITLADNVDLHLEMGATIAFSADASRYPTVLTRYQGIEVMTTSPAIYAHGCKNVGVTGAGVLDGSATAAWNTDSGAGWTKLQAWGKAGTAVTDRVLSGGDHVRVALVEPYGCEGVVVQGVTMRGSPFWTLHPTLSKNVLVEGVTIQTTVHNADGCDPESSSDVVIRDCTFDVADDCVAVKSGRDEDGHRLNTPSQNVVVMSSRFRSSYGMITVGSEESGGVHHVYAHDLQTTGPVKYVLWVKSNRERGGDLSDIHVDTVKASNVTASVVWATLNYEWSGMDKALPSLDQISASHLTVDGAPQVLILEGLPSSPIGSFSLSSSTFTNIAKAANSVTAVKSLMLDQVTINGKPAN
jgi:polygalacturonase